MFDQSFDHDSHSDLRGHAASTIAAQVSTSHSGPYKYHYQGIQPLEYDLPPSPTGKGTSNSITPESDFEMRESRTFRVRGPFGVQVTLATSVPGRLEISFGDRSLTSTSSSETKLSSMNCNDLALTITMHDATAEPAAQGVSATSIMNNANQKAGATGGTTQLTRSASLAPTEVSPEEPTQEECTEFAQKQGAIVRDFAYQPLSSSPSPSPSVSSATSTHTITKQRTPAPETWCPFKALAEYDLRLSQVPRTYPISGKTLRRLLGHGWISLPEAHTLWAQMDWDALAAYDAYSIKTYGSTKGYPYKPMKGIKPDSKARAERRERERGFWENMDRIRREEEERARQEERDMEAIRKMQEREREREERENVRGNEEGKGKGKGKGKQQAVEEGEVDMDVDVGMDISSHSRCSSPSRTKRLRESEPDDHLHNCVCGAQPGLSSSAAPTGFNAKRRRVTPPPCCSPSVPSASASASTSTSASASSSTQTYRHSPHPGTGPPIPLPPAKQYPAPLESYDPSLYPHADIIRAQGWATAAATTTPTSVSSTTNAAIAAPLPPTMGAWERATTPPIEELEAREREQEDKEGRKRKGLGRTLSRTQSYKVL